MAFGKSVAGTAEGLDAIGAEAFSEFYPWSGKQARTHNVTEQVRFVNPLSLVGVSACASDIHWARPRVNLWVRKRGAADKDSTL